MKWVVLVVVLAGCDKLFLQENALEPDAPEGPPSCAPEFADGRYFVVLATSPWRDAEATCSSLNNVAMESHLAVIGDATERLAISALVSNDPWVGLTSRGAPMTFHWITREPAPVVFSANQPDNDGQCGRLDRVGMGVADSPCLEKRVAVCECDAFAVDPARL